MSRVLIVGGGAAGMFAAVHAARRGHEVRLFEKNDRLGRKLFITGKGRCNLTNACGQEELFEAVLRNSKFLYSSFYVCTNQTVMDFFEELGLKLKVERGNRVFPASDHSSDVIRVLSEEIKRQGAAVHLHAAVQEVAQKGEGFVVRTAEGTEFYGDSCIIATGGLSYPATGSTGDGYRWAKMLGHQVTPLSPGLVPVEVKESWALELQGLSLKNVTASVWNGGKKLYESFGEMLFTHYGVSGPLILTASSSLGAWKGEEELTLSIDLKPALSEKQLDQRILRDFEENKNRLFKNALGKLFPAKLIPVMVNVSGIAPEKQVNMVSKEERRQLVRLIKDFRLILTGFRDYNEAIITRGGISVKEIDPGTMESKKVKNLYFAGEILDLDAVTGGFNLQIAWSTAYVAAMAVR